MRFLLRLATRAAWPGGEPDRERALVDFRLRDGELGLSVWAYESTEELDLILGAITCDRLDRAGKADKIDFLEIPLQLVDQFGTVTTTHGDSPVPRANLLHRELQWTAETLRALAEALFDANCAVKRVAKKQALSCALALEAEAIDSDLVRQLLEERRTGKRS